jgi:hypothetical protein
VDHDPVFGDAELGGELCVGHVAKWQRDWNPELLTRRREMSTGSGTLTMERDINDQSLLTELS